MAQQINDVINCFRKGINLNIRWEVKPLAMLDVRTFVFSADGAVPQIDEAIRQHPSGDCFFVGIKAYDIIRDGFKTRRITFTAGIVGGKYADSMQYRALSKTLIFEKDKSLDEFACQFVSFDLQDGK